ncbi:MAG: CBS domain-containing protein [Candidatus Bathyarchaeia archaeon]|nr:CBS domain-containing protein [Candidatus Bathyarchaeota archaeon]
MVSQRSMLVKDFLSECITVEPSTPVSKVIGLMKEEDTYEVFARVGNKIGTATVRDILRAKNPAGMKIENLLSFVPKLSPDTKLFEAARIMADYRLRALPIVQDNVIIGKIDVKALVNKIKDSSLGNITVSKIMTPSPATITPGERVSKAREIMLRRKIDHLPVERNGRVHGILTSEHIVFNLIVDYGGDRYVTGVSDTLKLLDYPVEAIMEKRPLESEPQTSIREVAGRMLAENRSYSLVTLGEELHGIVTYKDFTKLIAAKEETSVPVYIVGLPDDPFEAEAAKIKFIRLVNNLSRFLPSILEARSVIKTSSIEGQRRRYEVNVNIRSARETFNYTTSGWDLPALYDEVASAVKKMATSRKRARRGRTPAEE